MFEPRRLALLVVFFVGALTTRGARFTAQAVSAPDPGLLRSQMPSQRWDSARLPDVVRGVSGPVLARADPFLAPAAAVIVYLDTQPDYAALGARREVAAALREHARREQAGLQALLAAALADGRIVRYTPFWIFNGFALEGDPAFIATLAGRPEVARIIPDATYHLPALAEAPASPAANLEVIGVPDLWALGAQGQGVVVAALDTGVSLSHPELLARWRGGENSWFDPYGEHPNSPIDLSGHGTAVMGVMVAGTDDLGTDLGVAPQAQWIAARIFDDRGRATASAIHQAYQWLLDPDGDPATPDAPQVVNNSWGTSVPECDLQFQPDLQALRAAGILPIFSGGNFGPDLNTGTSPANYPEALAVGFVDNDDLIQDASSRGPNDCGQPETTYPDLVAPGTDIRTTTLFGLYTTESGASLAAPHVAGGLALLLSVFPGAALELQEETLLTTAYDLGAPGPDNDYGNGRLDLMAAYAYMEERYVPPPPPPPPVFLPVAFGPLEHQYLPLVFGSE